MKTQKNMLWPLLTLLAVESSHLMAGPPDDRGGSGGTQTLLIEEDELIRED
jgi:hypothetical protein